MDLEAELARARQLSVDELADAIESIGFECTRCGACCKAIEGGADGEGTDENGDRIDEHTATVFPDEIRRLRAAATETFEEPYDWRDVARPMPYGLSTDDDPAGRDELVGETFEWALAVADCGDCTFYTEAPDGTGSCTVHDARPLICETYPFSVVLSDDDFGAPMGDPVDRAGPVRAHECEGLGRDIDREDAEALAATLKERTIREREEAIAVADAYTPTDADGVVVHDSEGAKRPDGTPL